MGKKNGIARMFNEIVPGRKLRIPSRFAERGGATRISCMRLCSSAALALYRSRVAAGAFVYSICRNNRCHGQYAEIYRPYGTDGAYTRTPKNVFFVNCHVLGGCLPPSAPSLPTRRETSLSLDDRAIKRLLGTVITI